MIAYVLLETSIICGPSHSASSTVDSKARIEEVRILEVERHSDFLAKNN